MRVPTRQIQRTRLGAPRICDVRPQTKVPQLEEARSRVFGKMIKRLQRPYSLCLFDGLECENEAIKAHSIQNAGTLERLCRKGHVIMPRLVLTRNEPPRFEFRAVGRNNATTFTGLCDEHDAQLFRPIDIVEIDVENQEHLFLLSYRALLREVHSTIKTAIDTQMTYQWGIEEGLFPKDVPCALGEQAVEQMFSAWLIDQCREEYERVSTERAYHDLQHRIFELDVGPSLAVSSMFTTEVMSEVSGDPSFVTLNVFPHGNRTIAVFSFRKSESSCAAQAFEDIFNATGHYLLYEISKLVLRKCENFVLAPDVFERFTETQVEKLTEYFERNICGHVYEAEAPELFLFGACR